MFRPMFTLTDMTTVINNMTLTANIYSKSKGSLFPQYPHNFYWDSSFSATSCPSDAATPSFPVLVFFAYNPCAYCSLEPQMKQWSHLSAWPFSVQDSHTDGGLTNFLILCVFWLLSFHRFFNHNYICLYSFQ